MFLLSEYGKSCRLKGVFEISIEIVLAERCSVKVKLIKVIETDFKFRYP